MYYHDRRASTTLASPPPLSLSSPQFSIAALISFGCLSTSAVVVVSTVLHRRANFLRLPLHQRRRRQHSYPTIPPFAIAIIVTSVPQCHASILGLGAISICEEREEIVNCKRRDRRQYENNMILLININ